MSVRLTLEEAISNLNQGWTQGAYARDHLGWKIVARNSRYKPVCYCAIGAIDYSYNVDRAVEEEVIRLLYSAIFPNEPHKSGGLGRNDILDWNDAEGRTQDEVLAVFNKALELYYDQNR